jgi:hypothetical protein
MFSAWSLADRPAGLGDSLAFFGGTLRRLGAMPMEWVQHDVSLPLDVSWAPGLLSTQAGTDRTYLLGMIAQAVSGKSKIPPGVQRRPSA